MKDLKKIREEIIAKSTLGEIKNREIIKNRFGHFPNKLNLIYKKINLGEKRVLEIGCAFGQILIQAGQGSLGVDINQQAITFIRDLGMEGLLLDVDKSDLKEIPDNSFDIIYIADTIEHLESAHRLLVKLRDKLKDDGYLIIYVHVLPKYKTWQYFARRILKIEGLWSVTHYYQYNFDTFCYLMERAGFRVKDYFISGFAKYWVSKFFTLFLKNIFPIMFFVGRKDELLIKQSNTGMKKNIVNPKIR